MNPFYIWILFFLNISLLFSCKKASSAQDVQIEKHGYNLYRQGLVLQERIQFQQALEVYRQAIDQAIAVKDSSLIIQCYLQTCRIFRYQSLKEKALFIGKQSMPYLEALPNDSLKLVMYEELGDIYALSGQQDSASAYYQRAALWQKLALLSMKANDYDQAKTYLRKGVALSGGKIPDKIALAFTRLFLEIGQPDSAAFYLSTVSTPHWQLFSYQAKLSELKGDTLQAAFYEKSANQQLWSSEKQKNENQILQLQLNMDNRSWEQRLKKEQLSNRRTSYLWGIIILTGFAGSFFFVRAHRNKRQGLLTEAAFRSSEIYIRFHRKEEWKPKGQDWEELLHAFEQTYPGFYERLKAKVPQLTQTEWYMCCLIKIEVSPSTIAMLLCCTYQAISMRRVRLYQKITGEKGTPEQCDAFVRDI